MSAHRHYKPRNFDFAQQLVTLRRRAGLTQKAVALQLDVGEKSIRNWEGGINYPSDASLRKLIELYFSLNIFTSGQERTEAHKLWEHLRALIPQRIGSFDEPWFASLLTKQQMSNTGNAHPSEDQPSALLAFPTAENHNLPSSHSFSPLSLQEDWHEIPGVFAFYGRTDELDKLERWLLTDHCRLVGVLGMGGIGKTALVVTLIQQIAPSFDCVLWYSLQNGPPLENLLSSWLPILPEQQYTDLSQGAKRSLALFLKFLKQRRCLLVLDNLETILQEGVLEDRYRQGYEEYATLIRQVVETPHQSCLLLTSREKFPDLGILTGKQAPVRLLRLGGLAWPACQQLLQDKELFGDQTAWSELVERYAGNPLALQIVAEVVHELFGGDVAAFLAEGFTTFHGIRQLLSQQFERLSALEQALMYWLAIERELISLEVLGKNLYPPAPKGEILEAMHALRSRSLVEHGEYRARFTLQPVVLEYVTERLIAQVSQELCENKPALFLTHALLQGQAKDYIRMSQERLLLQPVLDQLASHFETTQALEEYCEHLLQQLRAMPRARQGYGGGNIVNLLVKLNGYIRNKDCSHLAVWQADLRKAEAQDTNFAGADLTGSAFLETLEGIVSVALSDNGHYLAAGSINGQIHLWRVMEDQLLLTLRGHTRIIWSVAFHPENRLLASGGYDGLVKVWEVSSGQCVRTLQNHIGGVRSVAFHPEGRLLATGGDDGSIKLWDLPTGECTRIWHEQNNGISSVAFSPDGLRLACGDVNGVVKLWDVSSEQCLWSATAHRDSVPFSPYGVLSIAFSPDSELLVSGGNNARITIWRTRSGEYLGTLSGHMDQVHAVAFNKQGMLASGSQDGTIKFWKVESKEKPAQYLSTLHGNSKIWSIAFGPQGLLASGSQNGVVKLWQIPNEGMGGRCLRTLQGYSRQVNAVALNQDGTILVSSEHNGIVRMWETKSGRCLHILSRQAGGSGAAAFSPDGRLFAHGSLDKTIGMWNGCSGQFLKTLQEHQGTIWSVAFSPDARFLLSCSLDMTVKRWDVESGKCLTTLHGHKNWVWSVAYSPDGQLLASGDIDGVIKLWEVKSGRCLRTLQGSSKAIVALAFASDGQTLLSSSEEHITAVWDIQSGHCLRTIPGIGDTYWLRSVAYSVDGNLLAAASRDQTIKIWDVNSGDLLRALPCQVGRPWSVAWSADQRWLACGTDEGTILLVEWQTGTCLLTLRGERPYERMNISGLAGLTEAQKVSLKALGATEEENKTQQGKSGYYLECF